MVQGVLDRVGLNDGQFGSLRFCGRNIVQSDGLSISVARHKEGDTRPTLLWSMKLRSSEQWLDHWEGAPASVDLNLFCGMNMVQSVCPVGNLEDPAFRRTNKLCQEAKDVSKKWFMCKSGLLNWRSMDVVTITDASFWERSWTPPRERTDDFDHIPDAMGKEEVGVHLISQCSTILGRMCQRTLQAATYALIFGSEESTRIRAATADAQGCLLRDDWGRQAAKFVWNVWVVDCSSLDDRLKNPTGGLEADDPAHASKVNLVTRSEPVNPTRVECLTTRLMSEAWMNSCSVACST